MPKLYSKRRSYPDDTVYVSPPGTARTRPPVLVYSQGMPWGYFAKDRKWLV